MHDLNKLLLCWMMLAATHLFGGQGSRPVTPADCVQVRYIVDGSITFSPDGTRVAYLVKAPNLATNENDLLLYVRRTEDSPQSNPSPMLTTNGESAVRWLGDGMHLALLLKRGLYTQLAIVDVVTGKPRFITNGKRDIVEFSLDRDAQTIVYATEYPPSSPEVKPTREEEARGYRIPFEKPEGSNEKRREVFVLRRNHSGTWTQPTILALHAPFADRVVTIFPYTYSLRMSVSPNGRYLLLTYLVGDPLPAEWQKSLWVKKLQGYGATVLITALYDLKTGSTSMPLATPWAYGLLPMWAPDSQSFIENASSPAGSEWEKDDEKAKNPGTPHLFAVAANTGKIQSLQVESGAGVRPVYWNNQEAVLIQTSRDTVVWYSRTGGVWKETGTIRIPTNAAPPSGELASNGKTIIGTAQAPAIAPHLYRYRLGSAMTEAFADMNPQFQALVSVKMEHLTWKTHSGLEVSGLLLKPTGYRVDMSYPLVIQTQVTSGNFLCDSGESHFPSFAPLPMATAGMLYLVREVPNHFRRPDDEPFYPKEYPGGLGEAALDTDVWDSAVETLAKSKIVDPSRVGIIGFSRSGWYTEFALLHGRTRYRAATLADNIQYSLSEYVLYHTSNLLGTDDAMYGGPPYADTFKSWQTYSPTFNMESIHTPVLLEVMGYGQPYDNPKAPPLGLASRFELFTGLHQLGKPIELYYYPDEQHQPDHPMARLASLQRNLDWYRFWLQGEENSDVSEPTQYARWHDLRCMQEQHAPCSQLPTGR